MNMENGDAAHELCRICGNFFAENSDFVAIFEDDPQLEINEFIKNELSAWQLKIMPNDGLPQRICGNCFARFCGIHSFRQECVEAQRKFWQSLLQECSGVACLVGDVVEASLQLGMTDSLGMLSSDDFLLPASEVPMEAAEVVVGNGFETVAQEVKVATPTNNGYSSIFSKDFANEDFPNEALINSDSVPESLVGVKPADVLDIVPTVPPQNLDIVQQVALAQDSLTSPKDLKPVIEHIEIQDLEEMLQGSIIPTLKDREKSAIVTATVTSNLTATTTTVPNIRTDAAAFTDVPEFHSNRVCMQPNTHADYNSASTTTDDDEEQEEIDEMNRDVNMPFSTQPLSCQYCYCSHMDASENVIFKDAEELSQHLFDAHDPKLPYICSYCSAVFQTAKQRDHHVREQHAANLPSEVCAYCKKKLRSPIEVHQYTCSYVDNWECEACGKKFFNAPLHRFRVHQRHHDPTKQLRCKMCSRVFIRRVNLEAHERDHVKQSDGPLLTCDECHAVFINDYELKRHKYQMHKGEPPARCTHCNKGFVSNAFLNRHMQNFHSSEVDGSLTATCTNCDTTFSSVNKLRNHLQRRRDENGKCRVEVVKEPKRRQRVMNHPCSHCARRFHSLAQLERHLVTHDPQQRPIQCEQCHVRCRTINELQQHMRVAHPVPVQPFVCDICGKSFVYKKELLNHTLYHTELKYACKTASCDFVGNNEIDLSAHVWQQHVLVPCKYCGETFIGNKLNAHMQNAHGHFENSSPSSMGTTAAGAPVQQSMQPVMCSSSYNEIIRNDISCGKYMQIELSNGHDQLDLDLKQQQELQQQQQDQQQLEEDDDSTYKSMSHSTHDEDEQMSQYFIGNLLDSEHEIIVT